MIAAGLFASMALPPAAWSLPALPAGSPADRLSRMLQSAAGPARVKPQTLPRSKLENDFAVLLMRTSYSVADQLDYYPMDKSSSKTSSSSARMNGSCTGRRCRECSVSDDHLNPVAARLQIG